MYKWCDGIVLRRALCGAAVTACVACSPETQSENVQVAKNPRLFSSHARYFEGLGEIRIIEKGATFVRVRQPNGAYTSLPATVREDRAMLASKFGAMEPALARRFDRVRSGQMLPVAVYLRTAPDPTLESALRSGNRDRKVSARRAKAARYASVRAAALAHLRGLGLADAREGAPLPIILGNASRAAADAIARDSGVKLVALAEPREFVRDGHQGSGPCGTNATSPHEVNIAQAFWNEGYFGDGEDVMMSDQEKAGVRSTHNAFTLPPNSLGGAAPSCTTLSDCTAASTSNVIACIGGKCLNRHATAVAGVLAETAPNANLYMAATFNSSPYWSVPSVGCSPQGLLDAYNEAVTNTFTAIVNESWHCREPEGSYRDGRGLEGRLQDYMAREYDLTITKSAGNHSVDTDHTGPLWEACPFSLNTICVGANSARGDLSCFSNWINPNTAETAGGYFYHDPDLNENPYFDREEPDITQFGGQETQLHSQGPYGAQFGTAWDCQAPQDESVCVADIDADNDWRPGRGTSFAAPSLAGLIALLRHKCRDLFSLDLDHRMTRSRVMVFGTAANPHGWRYSTRRTGLGLIDGDHRDGAGFGTGAEFQRICSNEEDPLNPHFFNDEPTDTNGGDPPPPDERWDQPIAPNETLAQTLPEWDQTRRVEQVWPDVNQGETLFLAEGARIRSVLSWDSCADTPDGIAPSAPSVDFDLMLYSPDHGWIYSSMSNDDTNEGFDWVIPQGQSGEYRIFLSWPEGQTGCDGSNIVPRSVSTRWWPDG